MPVQTRRIELSELRVRPGKVEASKSVEASLRLDAIASAGFKMSRSKMLDRIKAGGVRSELYSVSFLGVTFSPLELAVN